MRSMLNFTYKKTKTINIAKMNDYRELAKAWINQGYSVIPVNKSKMPSIPQWGKYQITPMTEDEVNKHFENCFGIALLAGGDGRLTIFDFDLKYSLNPYLWDEVKTVLGKSILEKAWCQSTTSGGYHMIFKCPTSRIKNNMKLASRYTTTEERHIVYLDAYNNVETRHKALDIAKGSQYVLFETRGFGGYALIAPSPGYKKIFGKINEISEEEYDFIEETLRSFNEVRKEDKGSKSYSGEGHWEVGPFEDFKANGDIIEIMTGHGWKVARESDQVIDFLRPGNTPTRKSAMFDKTTGVFTCFSTSTAFDTNRSYDLTGVLGVLEFEEDYAEVYKHLIEKGFGIKK